jgi:uncharacterized protein (DUF924 family)
VTDPAWAREVLDFWFSELEERDWWTKSEAIDGVVRSRFLGLHERLAATEGGDAAGPRATLAAVIALDQFPRNLFRGSPRAYSTDAIARRLATQAVAGKHDLAMRPEERLFLYLPFEHSEDRSDQALSVELISKLGREDWTRYAVAHKVIIDRFGRFPHRNAVLGRTSTAEEIAALAEPMSSF